MPKEFTIEPSEAHLIASQLLLQYGLNDWSVVFNTNKKRLGVCKETLKRIELSLHMMTLHSRQEVIDVIKHEIAHAIVGCRNGHNEIWRQKAIELGCSGNRCGRSMEVTGIFVATCPKCQQTLHKHRRPRNKRSCYHTSCGPNAIIKWEDWRIE